MRRALLLLATSLLVAACGGPVVVGGETPSAPYDGPMHLPQDFRDNATPLERSGAAGRALECDGKPYAGGAGDYDGGQETVQDSPAEAVQNLLAEDYIGEVPPSGYRVEREDAHRVLLSYDVGAHTKVAFIAFDGLRDWDGGHGWGIESWAECDLSELPASVTDDFYLDIWEDRAGRRVPVTTIRSFAGSEHCDWQDITYLRLGPERTGQEYLRDVTGELSDFTRTTYRARATLPADATDTGYHHDRRELWLVPGHRAAYLVSTADPSDVERWPAWKEHVGCA